MLVRDARIPVIALDYSEKEKRSKKELMVDYDNGKLYIVSAENKDIIFDITQKIIDASQNMPANNITIYIDGVGEVNLGDILNDLYSNQIMLIDKGERVKVMTADIYDLASITNTDGTISVKGFNTAGTYYIPIKSDGVIKWVPINGFNVQNIENDTTITLSPSTPFYTITVPATTTSVSIAASDLKYSKIVAFCTGDVTTLTFESSVHKSSEFAALTYATGMKYLLTFETFDGGVTWYVDCTQYL